MQPSLTSTTNCFGTCCTACRSSFQLPGVLFLPPYLGISPNGLLALHAGVGADLVKAGDTAVAAFLLHILLPMEGGAAIVAVKALRHHATGVAAGPFRERKKNRQFGHAQRLTLGTSPGSQIWHRSTHRPVNVSRCSSTSLQNYYAPNQPRGPTCPIQPMLPLQALWQRTAFPRLAAQDPRNCCHELNLEGPVCKHYALCTSGRDLGAK